MFGLEEVNCGWGATGVVAQDNRNGVSELGTEKRRADHLASITGKTWVVVSETRNGKPRLWTYSLSTLQECPLLVPHEIVYTAEGR